MLYDSVAKIHRCICEIKIDPFVEFRISSSCMLGACLFQTHTHNIPHNTQSRTALYQLHESEDERL